MSSSNRPGDPNASPDSAAGAPPDQTRPPAPETPSGRAEPTKPATSPHDELNGTFLRSYDTSRAESERHGAPAWCHRHARRARSSRLELQAAMPESAPDGRRAVPELILAEDNLLPFHFLRTGDRLGRAVVKIQRGDGATGTGFLVSPGILLTNHHVLPDIAAAASARVLANFEAAPPPDSAGRSLVVPLNPGLLFLTEPDLDVTFCAVEGLEELGVVPMGRDSLNILPSEAVNIIQHPRGRPKEVALQDNRVVKVDNVVLQYRCDTEPGSSGSPVFNNQWQLVALHHASVVSDDSAGLPARGLNPNSRFLNEGVRISAIAVWLETLETSTPEASRQADRLRSLFGGLDPQIGFFGALGRRPVGESAAEAVVECYHSDATDLDLAFWNLSTATADPLGMVSELGWVIANMKFDAWCLTHVDGDVLRALCEHMESHFRLEHQFLLANDADAPPVAVLYRRSAMRSATWVRPDADKPESAWGPRLLLRVADGRGRTATVALVPVLRGMSGKRRRIDRLGADPAAELLFFGDDLSTRELQALSGSGVPLRAALGPDGAFALLAGSDSPFGTIFASPNLDLTYGLSSDLIVARHRRWPEALETLGGQRPIAVRLTFSAPAKPKRRRRGQRRAEPARPTPETTTLRVDPPEPAPIPSHLEHAIRDILARFEAESHRRAYPDAAEGPPPPG